MNIKNFMHACLGGIIHVSVECNKILAVMSTLHLSAMISFAFG